MAIRYISTLVFVGLISSAAMISCGNSGETSEDADSDSDVQNDPKEDSESETVSEPEHETESEEEFDFSNIDPLDECPFDRDKFYAGICGCGIPETDSDGDGVPDCTEFCPADPNHVQEGDCGCVGSPDGINAGAPCNDGDCPGPGTCDERGVCVAETDCRPDTSCFAGKFGDRKYWFCNEKVTWEEANTRCKEILKKDLASLGVHANNLYVNNVLVSKGLDGKFWIGANDLTEEGKWGWARKGVMDNNPFWSGAEDGQQIDYRYSMWRDGEAPNGGEAQNCAAVTKSEDMVFGTVWDDENCADLNPYICSGYTI